ncbi:MAG: endonuclease III [Candidatus Aegiribacteria sp.]|nr:endonuclease III [Candidatus Aegiribacteria sp.]
MKQAADLPGTPAPLEESHEAFPVLVSTVISLRTRDAVTRAVSARVLKSAPDVKSMISIDREELEKLLRPAGFFRQKAKQLKQTAELIQSRFEGEVPDNIEDLLSLPGVGRKTANFVLGMVFGKPAICVDVHVHRISNRLGLACTSSPEETEMQLQKMYPPEYWSRINHIMVTFGQRICKPVKPLCEVCPLSTTCPVDTSKS